MSNGPAGQHACAHSLGGVSLGYLADLAGRHARSAGDPLGRQRSSFSATPEFALSPVSGRSGAASEMGQVPRFGYSSWRPFDGL